MFVRRVFLPFATGYFLSQLFRSVNAVVSADLIRDLRLDAWTVGFLTSAFFLAFAVGQLPVGVALDRVGPRRTESFLLIFAALGSLLFSQAGSTSGLVFGRALIGLGVSACLMASFHSFTLWAPPSRLPFLNGAVMAAGALGALTSTAPVEWAARLIGWRSLFLALSVATLAVAAFVYRSAPDPAVRGSQSFKEVARGLAQVFSSRAFWSVAPLSIAQQGTFLAIQGLWAGPWLRDVAGLDTRGVAAHLFTLAVAMGVGFLGIGFVSERLDGKGIPPLAVWIGCATGFQLTQGAITFGPAACASWLWPLFGFFGASGMLSYVTLTRRFPTSMTGRVNAALNVLVFTSAFTLQAGIGAIIQSWSGSAGFSPEGYRVAFGGALVLQTLCLLWLVSTSSWRRDVTRTPQS
jgi:predicted MFS family arabinose efflux permease